MKYLILLGLIAALAACDQKSSFDGTKERAKAEGEANRDVENKNLAEKAQKMEADLNSRHQFYSAMEGDYEGALNVAGENYKIKFTFVRSIPPYTGSRTRELSEIENDLNNLYFHLQVVEWHPSDASSAVGCRITGIRPNLDEGSIYAASADCPNLYSILISEGGDLAFTDRTQKAKSMALQIHSGQVSEVPNIIGFIQPSSNASRYTFSVSRVK